MSWRPFEWAFFWPALAFVAVTTGVLVARGLLLSALRRAAPGSGGAALADSIRLPSLLWAVVIGFFVGLETAELPARLAEQFRHLLRAAIILSVTITAAGVAGTLVARAGERRALTAAVTGWAHTSVRLAILIVGGLVLMSSLGIQVAPILTALGVGGLAVALALQDTLSNLFAGLHLLADRPIRIGDYVKISEGNVEGYVVDIGWRSTRIRMLANNIVVLPNQKVAQSVITNFDLPAPRMGIGIQVSVDYANDPDRVEAVLTDEAVRAVGEVPGLLGDPAPSARLIPGFGASSLDFTIGCQVATFTDQYFVQHELRRRILRRLRAERIALPLAVRTVQLRLDAQGVLRETIEESGEAGPLPDEREQGQSPQHRHA
jgi:small-conductance mechanosensitive channel